MARFLLDEDVPADVAKALKGAGHEVTEVWSTDLRGKTDREIIEYSCSKRLILVSRDLGFANELDFPPGSHSGIIVLRFPTQLSTKSLAEETIRLITTISEENLPGSLTILEPRQVRQRKSKGKR